MRVLHHVARGTRRSAGRGIHGLFLICLTSPGFAWAQRPRMTPHFIAVGQAHATLLEFPCGAMLIDAGADEDHGSALATYLAKFFQRRSDLADTIDVVLITHNHIDHTSSLQGVVEAAPDHAWRRWERPPARSLRRSPALQKFSCS